MSESLSSSELFDSFVLSDQTSVEISRFRQPVAESEQPSPEFQAGNVLRRLCSLGGSACARECQLAADVAIYEPKWCADDNLDVLISKVGLTAESVLMLGVTADGVGFYDQLSDYEDNMTANSIGVRELPGFNAFFAKDSEDMALGARLADCGFAAIEMTAGDGELVRGFVHLTRPNLQGETALKFAVDGEPAGCFEYFLSEALNHYGADKGSVRVRLVAAIKAENFEHRFSDRSPEDLFPGWFDQGMLLNVSNPDWKPGDELNPDDVWLPQYRQMLDWQMARSGISPDQIEKESMIDPADLELGHASNHAGAHGRMPDARDLYLVRPS